MASVRGHSGPVTAACVGPGDDDHDRNGNCAASRTAIVLTGSNRGSVRVWRSFPEDNSADADSPAASLKLSASLPCHRDWVMALALAPRHAPRSLLQSAFSVSLDGRVCQINLDKSGSGNLNMNTTTRTKITVLSTALARRDAHPGMQPSQYKQL